MSFHEVRLPIDVERGAAGGPGFLTTVNLLTSGKEQRNGLWEQDRGRWDVAYGIQTREQALYVRDFFMARQGRLYGFRFRDWSNYEADKQPLREEPDDSRTTFSLSYRYIDNNQFFYDKLISKPRNEDFQIFRDNTLVPSSQYSLNRTTGIVTFTSPPSYGDEYTWSGTFDLPVRFDTDELQVVITTKEVISFPSLPVVELKV